MTCLLSWVLTDQLVALYVSQHVECSFWTRFRANQRLSLTSGMRWFRILIHGSDGQRWFPTTSTVISQSVECLHIFLRSVCGCDALSSPCGSGVHRNLEEETHQRQEMSPNGRAVSNSVSSGWIFPLRSVYRADRGVRSLGSERGGEERITGLMKPAQGADT